MFFIFLSNSVFSLMLTLVVCQQRALFRNQDSGFTYGNFVSDRNRYLSATIVRSDLIEDEDECPFNCIFEPQCYSFNIAAHSDSNGLYLYELLITDKYRAVNELRVNDNFHHFSFSVSLCQYSLIDLAKRMELVLCPVLHSFTQLLFNPVTPEAELFVRYAVVEVPKE